MIDPSKLITPETEEEWEQLRMALVLVPEDVKRTFPEPIQMLEAMLRAHDADA